MEHRAGVEVVVAVVAVGAGELPQVEDQAADGEVGDVGARDPEDVGAVPEVSSVRSTSWYEAISEPPGS